MTYSDSQELFWQLNTARGVAMSRYEPMRAAFERLYGPDVDPTCLPHIRRAKLAVDAVEDQWRAFCREHKGQTFKVFRPEDVDRAYQREPRGVYASDQMPDVEETI